MTAYTKKKKKQTTKIVSPAISSNHVNLTVLLLPHDARSAKRCIIAVASRPSVCLSVCDVEEPWAMAYRLD